MAWHVAEQGAELVISLEGEEDEDRAGQPPCAPMAHLQLQPLDPLKHLHPTYKKETERWTSPAAQRIASNAIGQRAMKATLSGGQVQGLVMLQALLLSPAYVTCRL